MKIRITKAIEGLSKGDILSVGSHPPHSWAGHYELVDEKAEAKAAREEDKAGTQERDPLDHDGDGKKGGAKKG